MRLWVAQYCGLPGWLEQEFLPPARLAAHPQLALREPPAPTPLAPEQEGQALLAAAPLVVLLPKLPPAGQDRSVTPPTQVVPEQEGPRPAPH